MAIIELSELETNLATLLIGVDSLFGGDVLHPSGTRHFIADTWISGMKPPEIYYDKFSARLRKKGGIRGVSDAQSVNDYVKRFQLWGKVDAVHEAVTEDENGYRMKYCGHLLGALEVMLQTAIALANKKAIPSYEERYRAATLEVKDDEHFAGLLDTEIKPIDTKTAREALRTALAAVGYEVQRSRNLRETMVAWQQDEDPIPKEKVAEVAREKIQHLHELTRRNLIAHLDLDLEGHQKDLADVAFDNCCFKTVEKKFFTGSSIYRGGEQDSKPLLEALFEYNVDHPLTRPGLYHLCSHEVMPGHYFNSAITDLLWRAGKLPFEATMGTMATPSTVFQEGWAQNGLELIYGSREDAINDFGKDLAVEFALEDLEDIGKHNASILYQLQGKSIADVRRHLAEKCVLPDAKVRKLSGAWAKDPIIGPMYGPAYYIGRTIINNAIGLIGPANVARLGLHLEGLMDIGLFQEKVMEKYDQKLKEQLRARA